MSRERKCPLCNNVMDFWQLRLGRIWKCSSCGYPHSMNEQLGEMVSNLSVFVREGSE